MATNSNTKTYTDELAKLAADVPGLIDSLERKIAEVVAGMAALKKDGLTYATEHWRKGADGQPKYFYLLYPQKHGEPRRRVYVGCDAARIEKARTGIVRAEQYDKLAAQRADLEARARLVADALHEAQRCLSGRPTTGNACSGARVNAIRATPRRRQPVRALLPSRA
ncbi:hypothetical protein [Microvirgula aerodenitrificans]|uniref:hypothetical protein n=1 Tax=Microvirgula aerodenitrificans TaxID=57480 RepID=UPI00248F16EB|nr:hypothetical protein [Microvirgula aerodenitrificans]